MTLAAMRSAAMSARRQIERDAGDCDPDPLQACCAGPNGWRCSVTDQRPEDLDTEGHYFRLAGNDNETVVTDDDPDTDGHYFRLALNDNETVVTDEEPDTEAPPESATGSMSA
jgi:hypothetical protein